MTTLGHVCLVNPRSFVEPVGDDWPVSFVPMAAVEVRTGRIDLSQVRTYADVSKGYTRFSEGDVLFAKITPCMENGKIAIAKGLTNASGCGSTEFHVLRTEGGLSREYLMSFLLQDDFRKRAQRSMSGTAGQLRVPAAFLADAPFPLAPLPEQHRIVAEIEKQFTRLDASVESLKRAQANLKRCRASVLKSACEGSLVPTEAELARAEGRDYEPAGVLLERILAERRARWESQEKRRGKYKEPAAPDTSALPELPEGWVGGSLEQVSEIQGGIQKQPKRAPAQNAFPYLRVANVLRGSLELGEVHEIELFPGELDKLRLISGDLLIVEGNGSPSQIGRMAVWKGEIDDCVHQNHIIRARVYPGVEGSFIESFWNSTMGSSLVLNVASSTSGLYTLSVSKVSDIPVPLPPLAEQRRIVAEVERRLSVIQQAEAAVEASLQRAERLRQSILKRAFAGELVPQDPDDEPASVLLERIRAQREAEPAAASASKKRPARRRAKAAR
jgi:type I restriction enzyme S subunit